MNCRKAIFKNKSCKIAIKTERLSMHFVILLYNDKSMYCI